MGRKKKLEEVFQECIEISVEVPVSMVGQKRRQGKSTVYIQGYVKVKYLVGLRRLRTLSVRPSSPRL